MTSPSLQLEDAGYRRAQRQSLYVEDYHGLDYSVRSYRATPHGGSDEIRELQRRFPETLAAKHALLPLSVAPLLDLGASDA